MGGQRAVFRNPFTLKLDNFLSPKSQAKEQIDALDDSIAAQQSLLRGNAMNRQNTLRALRRNRIQSTETIELLLLNVSVAEETYRMYEEAYRRGAANIQNLYAARDSVSLAQNKLAAERYNLAVAILELKKELAVPFGSLCDWNKRRLAMAFLFAREDKTIPLIHCRLARVIIRVQIVPQKGRFQPCIPLSVVFKLPFGRVPLAIPLLLPVPVPYHL